MIHLSKWFITKIRTNKSNESIFLELLMPMLVSHTSYRRSSYTVPRIQWWAKWRLATFDLYLGGRGMGCRDKYVTSWDPSLPWIASCPFSHIDPTLWVHTSGGRGRGGALILDRCRAFDLFASVDALLCSSRTSDPRSSYPVPRILHLMSHTLYPSAVSLHCTQLLSAIISYVWSTVLCFLQGNVS